MNRILDKGHIRCAFELACEAHQGQKRKFTGEAYVLHPVGVMSILATVTSDEDELSAALLHDVVEDTSVTHAQLVARFGLGIADLVQEVTNVTTKADGPKEKRLVTELLRLAQVSARAKTLKLADIIDNTHNLAVVAPREYVLPYIVEKERTLSVLRAGNAQLFRRAQAILESNKRLLGAI